MVDHLRDISEGIFKNKSLDLRITNILQVLALSPRAEWKLLLQVSAQIYRVELGRLKTSLGRNRK